MVLFKNMFPFGVDPSARGSTTRSGPQAGLPTSFVDVGPELEASSLAKT